MTDFDTAEEYKEFFDDEGSDDTHYGRYNDGKAAAAEDVALGDEDVSEFVSYHEGQREEHAKTIQAAFHKGAMDGVEDLLDMDLVEDTEDDADEEEVEPEDEEEEDDEEEVEPEDEEEEEDEDEGVEGGVEVDAADFEDEDAEE